MRNEKDLILLPRTRVFSFYVYSFGAKYSTQRDKRSSDEMGNVLVFDM